jgi:hypothetical protein
MKSRKLIIALAAFSLLLVLTDGGGHLLKAKSAKSLLSIMKPEDQRFESMKEALHEHYESAGAAAVSAAALSFLIFTAARTKYTPNGPNN